MQKENKIIPNKPEEFTCNSFVNNRSESFSSDSSGLSYEQELRVEKAIDDEIFRKHFGHYPNDNSHSYVVNDDLDEITEHVLI